MPSWRHWGGVEHHHRAVDRGQGTVGVLAEILVARRVEQVEGEPLVLEAHHRRGDRDAALALDQSERTRRRSPRAFTSPASWSAPPNSSNFSVSVVLPASGCEMIAKVRRRAISSVSVLIHQL
jgi:hypothetical protein